MNIVESFKAYMTEHFPKNIQDKESADYQDIYDDLYRAISVFYMNDFLKELPPGTVVTSALIAATLSNASSYYKRILDMRDGKQELDKLLDFFHDAWKSEQNQ